MDKKEIKRSYLYKGVTAFLVVAACVLFFFFIYRISDLWDYFKKIIKVLQPVFIGFVIAYLVNPVVNGINRLLKPLLKRIFKKGKTAEKTSEITSVLVGLLAFIVVIGGIISLVIPQFINSCSNIITVLPGQIDVFLSKAQDFLKSNEDLENVLVKAFEYEKNWLQTDLTSYVNRLAGGLASGVWDVVNFVKNFGIGIIFAAFLLVRKATLMNQSRKLLFAFMKEEKVEKILFWFKKTHTVFNGFISGKLLEALMMGVLCFIGVSILKIPYAVLVSVIVGVTDIIPIFGPWIGGIPCAALILITDPLKGLYFIILIVLLQALEGNIIGPKILGEKTGLSTFWVVFAIVLGGGLFGVLGMLLGVPVFAVIYYIFASFVNHALVKKNRSTNSADYSLKALKAAKGADLEMNGGNEDA